MKNEMIMKMICETVARKQNSRFVSAGNNFKYPNTIDRRMRELIMGNMVKMAIPSLPTAMSSLSGSVSWLP